jgi:putative DNA primase/helicase
MKLVQLAAKLGGKFNGSWINIRGPGHSKDDFSLGIRFDPNATDGFIVYSLAGDDPSVCRKHVKEKLGQLSKLGQLELQLDNTNLTKTKSNASAFALHLWNEAEPIAGTPAPVYLESRGCAPASGALWPQDLGFHPACPFSNFACPALIGLIRDVITGEPIGLHRTALSDDGASKRFMPSGLKPKMMLGRASRAAIQLHPAGSILALAEGIETALSAESIFKVPVWAALSAGGIGSFPVIYGIKRLFIFADNDPAGLLAARKCRRRYEQAAVVVEVWRPTKPGSDWNDYLQRSH